MYIIRILPGVYNEADILEENLLYYIKQGIDTVVIDNGSTDNSYAICKKYVGKGIIKLINYYSKDFDTMGLLKMATLQCHELNPDWVVMADADEFIEPPIIFKNLPEAIKEADKNRSTIIKVFTFNFKITKKDNMKEKSVLKRMKYYICGNMERYRIWKYNPCVIIRHPHHPEFLWDEDKKVSSVWFALRHYPFRSLSQAQKKIKQLQPDEHVPIDWTTHYIKFQKGINNRQLFTNYKSLTKYNEDGKWNIENIEKESQISFKKFSQYLLKRFNSNIIEKKVKLYPTWFKNPNLIDLLLESYIQDRRFKLALAECNKLLTNIRSIETIIVKKKKKIKALISK